jgi:hypothetical protein
MLCVVDLLPSTEFDADRAQVEVIMNNIESSVASGGAPGAGSAASATLDSAAFVEKAIAALPPELASQVVDVKRKAKSQDPRWKYGWWLDSTKKDFVQCVLCRKIIPSGIKRFKQHLAGGFGDTMKCSSVSELISKEMLAYLRKNARSLVVNVDEDGGEDENEGKKEQVVVEPSSETKVKQEKKKINQSAISAFVVSAPPKPQTQKHSKSVSSMLCKTPEEVVAERHRSKTSQSTLEHCTKKDKEAKHTVDDHVVDFLYENNIPLNVVKSRSWEIMLESIGQYGPGYHSPSYHDTRVPLLDRAVDRTS